MNGVLDIHSYLGKHSCSSPHPIYYSALGTWKSTQYRTIRVGMEFSGCGVGFDFQEWSISNFSCSLTSNITWHSMENRAPHSLLRWKMFLLPNSHYLTYTFIFKRLGECTFWTWEWKGSPGTTRLQIQWNHKNRPNNTRPDQDRTKPDHAKPKMKAWNDIYPFVPKLEKYILPSSLEKNV